MTGTGPTGTDNTTRRVVVNADDLGLSHGVNAGIVASHRYGVVTSTSLMVCRAAAEPAADLAALHPELSVGLHLDLVEHQVVNGVWTPTVIRVDLDDPVAVEVEVRAQLDRFVALTATLPSHLDGHQHCHLHETVRPAVLRLAAELDVPVRGVTIPYRGSFYGQYGAAIPYPDGVTTAALVAAVVTGDEPFVEVGCHPATVVDTDDGYGAERLAELAALTSSEALTAIRRAGVELVNRSGRTRSRASSDPAVR